VGDERVRPVRVTVVCSGNICRSPIGEYVLRDAVARAGLADRVVVDSAGLGGWHVGQGADRRSVRVLADHGLDATDHAVQQITRHWFGRDDEPVLLLAMDTSHHDDLRRLTPHAEVRMYREFDPDLAALPRDAVDLDVPDPYYGDAPEFDDVYTMIEAATPGVIVHLRELLAHEGSE
jgi:protein-tyrosine phosphatase